MTPTTCAWSCAAAAATWPCACCGAPRMPIPNTARVRWRRPGPPRRPRHRASCAGTSTVRATRCCWTAPCCWAPRMASWAASRSSACLPRPAPRRPCGIRSAWCPASGWRATRCAAAPTPRWCGPATSTGSTCAPTLGSSRRASIHATTCSGRAACRWGTSAAPRSSSRRGRRSICRRAARWPTWCAGADRCRASSTRTPTCAATRAATRCATTTAWWWRTGRPCGCGAAWGPTSICSGAP